MPLSKSFTKQIVTTSELSVLLDVDPRHITRLRDKGHIVAAPGRGKWQMIESVSGYINYKREELQKAQATKPGSDNDIDNKIKAEKLRAERRKNALAEGKLVLAENLDTVVLDWCQSTAKYLSAIPLKVRRRFPEYAKLTNEGNQRLDAMITKEIRVHRNDLPNVGKLWGSVIFVDEEYLNDSDNADE